jgi:hypothetical protein
MRCRSGRFIALCSRSPEKPCATLLQRNSILSSGCVPKSNIAEVHDRSAADCSAVTYYSARFPEMNVDYFVSIETFHELSIKTQICQNDAGSQMCRIAENGICNVIEMGLALSF